MVDGLRHHLEGVGQQRQGGLAGVCQENLAACAAEQGGAGELFKLSDLLGNGAWRDVQLFCGAGEG